MFNSLFRKLAERKTRHQNREQFKKIFHFCADRASESVGEKEVLFHLALLANEILRRATVLKNNPRDHKQYYMGEPTFGEAYELAVQEYFDALVVFRYFNPALAAKIPHWTEMPMFLKEWLEGGNVEVNIEPQEPNHRPPLTLVS